MKKTSPLLHLTNTLSVCALICHKYPVCVLLCLSKALPVLFKSHTYSLSLSLSLCVYVCAFSSRWTISWCLDQTTCSHPFSTRGWRSAVSIFRHCVMVRFCISLISLPLFLSFSFFLSLALSLPLSHSLSRSRFTIASHNRCLQRFFLYTNQVLSGPTSSPTWCTTRAREGCTSSSKRLLRGQTVFSLCTTAHHPHRTNRETRLQTVLVFSSCISSCISFFFHFARKSKMWSWFARAVFVGLRGVKTNAVALDLILCVITAWARWPVSLTDYAVRLLVIMSDHDWFHAHTLLRACFRSCVSRASHTVRRMCTRAYLVGVMLMFLMTPVSLSANNVDVLRPNDQGPILIYSEFACCDVDIFNDSSEFCLLLTLMF